MLGGGGARSFEEVGVLLAGRDGEGPLDFTDAATAALFGDYRKRLAAKELTFGEMVLREDLRLATDRLAYFSRFVTPPYAPRRFDTRFVVAEAPAGQRATHDEYELVSGEWLTGADALRLFETGEQTIVPPTLENVLESAECGTVAGLFSHAAAKAIAPISPLTLRLDGAFTLIYPGDAWFISPLEPVFTSMYRRADPLPILRFRAPRGERFQIDPGIPQKGVRVSTTEERIARLEAIADIKELTAKYCWHVARGEGAAIVDLFTDDGCLDGTDAGMSRIEGRAALEEFYQAVNSPLAAIPFIHNHIIDVDGDNATGPCALDARFTRRAGVTVAAGYYLDTYRRVDGVWKFVERKLFFQQQVPLPPVPPPPG